MPSPASSSSSASRWTTPTLHHYAPLPPRHHRLHIITSLRSCTFSALEVIHLHRVYISDITTLSLVVGCPFLRTLDLRYCAGLNFLNIVGAGAHLQSLTVAKCKPLTGISAYGALILRSFRYSGAYVAAYIPATSTLADLCICFRRPGACCHQLRRNWLEQLTNLSNLSVLTLCNNALRRVSARARARSVARNAAPCKLHNLRELQLLMFAMNNENLDDIYVFLMNCCGLRLERLFVQLPTKGYGRAPKKELSGSESESEEDGPVEELSEGQRPEEAELEEERPEEAELEEELSEGEALEEDGLHEVLSEGKAPEEDGLQENLSEGEASEEDELEEELSEGELLEEDELDEAQSEAFENLMLLKMINFKGRGNEMRLVRLVLKKSTRLSQLILFTPQSNHPKGLTKDHTSIPQFIETKLSPLGKASPNAQIILGEPDDSAIQPFHCEGFVKVK